MKTHSAYYDYKFSFIISGLDLTDSTALLEIIQKDADSPRKAKHLYALIRSYQDSFTALEKVCNHTNCS